MFLDQWWIYTNEMYNARMIDWYRQQYTALKMTARVILGLCNICIFSHAVDRTCDLSEGTRVAAFRTYGFHSAGLCNCGPWEWICRRITSCKCGLTVQKCWARSGVFRACGGVSRGLFPGFRGCDLLYLRTVEYDQWLNYLRPCRASFDLA